MKGRVFVDTNIITYAHLTDEREKHEAAVLLLRDRTVDSNLWISTQILSEFYSSMSKNKVAHEAIVGFITPMIHSMNILAVSVETVKMALIIKGNYKFSYWDSLMLSAALECNCDVVYSEDLQHNQVIEGSLTIVNPFVSMPEKTKK